MNTTHPHAPKFHRDRSYESCANCMHVRTVPIKQMVCVHKTIKFYMPDTTDRFVDEQFCCENWDDLPMGSR